MTGSRRFGSWLKQQRRALDLTQRELARRAGCSTVTIHKIETGALQPSKGTAERLALCLDIRPEARAGFVRFARGGPLDPALNASATAPACPERLIHGLPFPATQLIGRADDLRAICARLRSGARLLTLTGPPGVGKTRLAIEAARQAAGDYPDGVFFISLASLAEPARVAKAIGQGLNIPEARAWSTAERIKIRLREKQVLLVLDNLEHVIEAGAFLAELLAACPWLTILATSREALRIRGERLRILSPLPAPPHQPGFDHRLKAAEALAYPSVALFVERAEAALPGFAFEDGDAEAVAEICRRLDGLPLAIELLAAHVNVLSPVELLERWTGPLVLTSTGLRDTPARQQTLQDAIEWSYRLLDEGEQALLRELAVFAGEAGAAAIEAVCGGESLERLASLVDKSLVQRVSGPGIERRFALLEIIRDYARIRLSDGGEEPAARLRHARYYRGLAAEARTGLGGSQQAAWFQRLERERANLHTALKWTLGDPALPREAVELGVGLAADLYGFWWLGSHLREGLTWLERALDAAGCSDDGPAIAELLWKAGACAGYLGLNTESTACFDRCVAMSRAMIALEQDTGSESAAQRDWRAHRVRRALAHALEMRAFFEVKRESAHQTQADLDEAIGALREQGDHVDLAHALISYGHWASRNGRLIAARAALEEGLALCEQAGNVWGQIMASGDLERSYEYAGDANEACPQWARNSVPPSVVEEPGEWLRVHVMMWWLHYLAGSNGDEKGRVAVLRKALALQAPSGSRSSIEGSLYEPAHLALQAGMPVRAVRLAAATEVWLEQLGLPLDYPPPVTEALTSLRMQLGEGPFAAAWREGRAMTIPASAAYALSGEE